MQILIFGKNNCAHCISTKSKVTYYLQKWDLAGKIPVVYHDMDSEDGRAEGCFYDVLDIPTTLVLDESGNEVGRWVKTIPPVEDLRAVVGGAAIDSAG